MKTKHNILIVGASGFLGKALTKAFTKTRHNIFVTSRRNNFKMAGVKVYCGDINDPLFCKKILRGIDVVYYLAGFKKNIKIHTENPFDSLSQNVQPFLTFLQTIKKSKVKTIVYISSTIVEYAVLEKSTIDGYVQGKYINEIILKAFALETKTDIKIVRTTSIFGPGDNFSAESANFIPSLIKKIDNSLQDVVVWGKGKRRMQFIFIDDLVNNLVEVFKDRGSFFVFGNNKSFSVNEIVDKLIKIFGKRLNVIHDLSKPDKKTNLSRFRNLISAKVDIDTGLSRAVEYYKKNCV